MPFNSDFDGAVKLTNTAGQDSVIWEYEVPVGAELHFPTKQPIEMKLYNSAGDEISDTSLVWFAVKRPHEKVPRPITKPLLYRKLKNLTPAQQADINTQISIYAIDDYAYVPEIIIKKKRKLLLYINSPDVVDWNQGSYFNLEETELRAAD